MIIAMLAAATLANGVQSLNGTKEVLLEAKVLSEVNYARTHPNEYLRKLADYKRRFRGFDVDDDASSAIIETAEGPSAVEEAIRYVQAQTPKQELVWDDELASAAAEHADEQRLNGEVGHEASDGAGFSARMARQTSLQRRSVLAEVITYGDATHEGVVRELIVDDGVADRGHRTQVFNASLHRAGVACKPHPIYGMSCVIDLSG